MTFDLDPGYQDWLLPLTISAILLTIVLYDLYFLLLARTTARK